jgi:hypothetical protein
MDWFWSWSGRCIGYRDGDNLWTYDGRHVGRFHGDDVHGSDGLYLGEIRSGDRLITKRSTKGNQKSRFRPLRNRVRRQKRVDRSRRSTLSGYEDFPEV